MGMDPVTLAIGGSALVGAFGASQAAGAQEEASTASLGLQKEMYDQTREDQEPWRLAGEKALGAIEAMPDFQFTAEIFEQFKDPGYEFRVSEGVNALDRSAASRGRLLSGAQDKAVTQYGQDMASQEYVNAFNRAKMTHDTNLGKQQSLAQVGQSATNAVSNANQSMATQGTNALTNAGNAQAGAYTGMATAANTGVGNYLLYDMMKPTPKT